MMLSLRILITAAAISMLPLASGAERHEIAALDYGLAEEYCDRSELSGPEGIWLFPDDETTVLIRKEPHSLSKFEMFVIDTPDCRLNPGEKIGELHLSADSKKFKLSLYTSRKTGLLTNARSCAVTLAEDGDALIVHPLKLNISFRPLWFLSGFWRAFRFSLDKPASRVPYGLIRLYPRSVPLTPFYL